MHRGDNSKVTKLWLGTSPKLQLQYCFFFFAPRDSGANFIRTSSMSANPNAVHRALREAAASAEAVALMAREVEEAATAALEKVNSF